MVLSYLKAPRAPLFWFALSKSTTTLELACIISMYTAAVMDGEQKTDSAVSELLARHTVRPPQHRLSRLHPLLPHSVDKALLDYNTDEMSSFSEFSEATRAFVLKAKP